MFDESEFPPSPLSDRPNTVVNNSSPEFHRVNTYIAASAERTLYESGQAVKASASVTFLHVGMRSGANRS